MYADQGRFSLDAEDCNRSLPLWVPGQAKIYFLNAPQIKGATEMADKKPAAAKKETAAPKSTKAKAGAAKATKPAKKK